MDFSHHEAAKDQHAAQGQITDDELLIEAQHVNFPSRKACSRSGRRAAGLKPWMSFVIMRTVTMAVKPEMPAAAQTMNGGK